MGCGFFGPVLGRPQKEMNKVIVQKVSYSIGYSQGGHIILKLTSYGPSNFSPYLVEGITYKSNV